MRPCKNFSRLITAFAVVTITAPPLSHADEQVGELSDDGITVKAQPLATALQDFSEQSGLQIAYVATLAENVSSKGTHDTHTAAAALSEILDSTGLEYQFVNDDTVAIGPRLAEDESGASDSGNARSTPSPVLMAQNQTSAPRNQTSATNNDDEDEEALKKMEEIVVTGTNIRGVSPDSSPSFVFDKEDIAKTGFGTVSEFVQSLPQNFSGGSNSDITTLANDRAPVFNENRGSSVNLRGLGSGATLVLLNGSRLAPAGQLGDFVDISMIPLSAVERVEVLTDGASAIYGADAIAGVVNFVLRDDYDGAETFVRFGSVTEGDMNEYRVGQTFGKSWDSGNALLSYEFFHRDNLGAEDKGFSSAALLPRDLLPKQESHNVLLTATQQLSDRIKLRGHGTFSQRDSSSAFTGPTATSTFTALFDSRSKQYGGAGGADIELWGDWVLDVSGTYSKVSEGVDPERLPPTFLGQRETRTDSDLWSLDGKVDGALFHLPGGEVKVAAGLSYREEAFLVLNNGVIGRQDDRNVFGAFGEAYLPIVGADNRAWGVERLELTLAGRYDDYNDFGSTFNPKVGLLWSPLQDLIFRGTYSTSFNPPNLGDTGDTFSAAFALNAPDPASPTGASLAIIDTRSNPNLGPEESTAWTAGVDYRHDLGTGEIDLSMTWFDISYTDRIGNAGISSLFLTDPVTFAPLITADPDPALIAAIIADAAQFLDFSSGTWTMPGDEDFLLDGRLRNLTATDSSGLDVKLAYTVDADIGQLNFGLNSTYLFKQEKQIISTLPEFDVVSTIFNPVDLRLRGNIAWGRDGWNVSTFVNYVDSYVDDRNIVGPDDLQIDSWTTVDINLSYDTGEGLRASLLDNTKFSLSVLNLFSQDPPSVGLVSSGVNFDATNASPLGRFISLQITKAW